VIFSRSCGFSFMFDLGGRRPPQRDAHIEPSKKVARKLHAIARPGRGA
jgi:hypothetical protein